MAAEWFFSRKGQGITGPCSSAELKRLAATGKLRPDDLVGKNRKVRFVLASSVKGLFTASTA
jgi:GYF domain 2